MSQAKKRTCRHGVLWGPARKWGPADALHEAYYCVAGFAHGFYRCWAVGGEKQAVEEYRFGIKVRRRKWNANGSHVDGSAETLPPPEDGCYPEDVEAHFERNRRLIADLGGDPDEVPAVYTMHQPGEWDDPPTPEDAARWAALGG